MPDIQTEMQKILHSWDEPKTIETTEQPKGPKLFAPTNNVSKKTFNFVRDNSGCTRNDAIRVLVQQGHKKSSVSSLLGQMVRQGHIYKDSDGLLRPNGKEYSPIKSAKTTAKREAKVKNSKTSKLRTSTAGITALVEEQNPPDHVQEIVNNISLFDAKRLYSILATYFGGSGK